tara:strand:- start:1520 stop:2215 length:696 start_codon:yes stop_codon:yes gene_type:complete
MAFKLPKIKSIYSGSKSPLKVKPGLIAKAISGDLSLFGNKSYNELKAEKENKNKTTGGKSKPKSTIKPGTVNLGGTQMSAADAVKKLAANKKKKSGGSKIKARPKDLKAADTGIKTQGTKDRQNKPLDRKIKASDVSSNIKSSKQKEKSTTDSTSKSRKQRRLEKTQSKGRAIADGKGIKTAKEQTKALRLKKREARIKKRIAKSKGPAGYASAAQRKAVHASKAEKKAKK